MRIVQIEWEEECEPNSYIRYNHVIGKSPLGNFIITWKKWKESPCFTKHTSLE